MSIPADLPIWQATLHGAESDITHLVEHFSEAELRIQRYPVTMETTIDLDGFTADTNPGEVRVAAEKLAAELSGVLKRVLSSDQPLKAGGVMLRQPNGTRHHFVHVESTAIARAFVGHVKIETTDAQGRRVPATKAIPRTVSLVQLMRVDETVQKVMRLSVASDSQDWAGLYRTYEVIRHDAGGDDRLALKGWSTKTQQERFRRSANSDAVSGDKARHAAGSHQPPKDPMTVSEACTFIDRLVSLWLAEKEARLTQPVVVANGKSI